MKQTKSESVKPLDVAMGGGGVDFSAAYVRKPVKDVAC